MARLKYTKDEIDERLALIGNVSNPNLLHNPFFQVNQREFATAPASPAVYAADRWKTYGYSGGRATYLDNGHLQMSGGNASGGSAFRQQFETDLPAGTYTFSVKVVSCDGASDAGNYGTLYIRKGTSLVGSATYIKGTGITTKTFTVTEGQANGVSFGALSAGTVEFECAKLERGEVSTLANDIAPDYGEELRKCQRYCYRINLNGGNGMTIGHGYGYQTNTARISVKLPVAMRTNPAVSVDSTTINSLKINDSSGEHQVTAISSYEFAPRYNPDSIGLLVTASGVAVGSACTMRMGYVDTAIVFSADL